MNSNTKAILIAMLGGMAVLSPIIGQAEEAKAPDPAPTPTHTFTPNLAVVNNYIFRGMTQTWNQPALQGGIDYSHTDGWYAGAWASNISDREYADGSVELDLYGGYNGKFPKDDWTWTVGLAGTIYPGADYDKTKPTRVPNPSQTYDNLEVNGGIGYKWVAFKLSAALTDYYGANTTTGYTSGTQWSTYSDLTATVPLPEDVFGQNVTLPLHVGHLHYTAKLQTPVAGETNPDYTDYKIGIAKGFDYDISLALALTYADNDDVYGHVQSLKGGNDFINMVGTHVVLSLTKTF
ncbi:MAG: hypothetical protein HQL87_14755 [Magnetococcales bacterium]|nr:hypothetical protein [Magnetococcales bacterium]